MKTKTYLTISMCLCTLNLGALLTISGCSASMFERTKTDIHQAQEIVAAVASVAAQMPQCNGGVSADGGTVAPSDAGKD